MADAASLQVRAPDAGAAGTGSAAAPPSVFSLFAHNKRFILYSAAFVSLLTPVTDTIILPTLAALSTSALPGASVDGAAALVSVYMACVGVATLVWGPLSDTFGRRPPLIASLVLYIASTVACIFAPSMGALILLRALQGCVTGSTIAITQGVVADAFAPPERGYALGVYFQPLLLGPIVAPVVGGLLSDALDWRGIFILLAAFSPPLLALVCAMPETQHYAVAAARRAAAPAAPLLAEELSGVLRAPPAYLAPWTPLTYLLDARIAPYTLLGATTFGALFSSLVALPLQLQAQHPHYAPGVVGALFLPVGVAMMASSLLGGRASDAAAAAAHPSQPSQRLWPALAGAAAMVPGCLLFGWGFAAGSLPAALAGHCLVGVGQAAYGPGFFSYLSQVKQQEAAGAAAAALALSFAAAGVCISAGPPATASLGVGGWFSVLAAVNALALAWALCDVRGRAGGKPGEADAAPAPAPAPGAAAAACNVEQSSVAAPLTR